MTFQSGLNDVSLYKVLNINKIFQGKILMSIYGYIVTFHVMMAGMWLLNLIFDLTMRKQILNAADRAIKENNVLFYLKYTNLFGMIGAGGISITGLLMVIINPVYSLFEFSSNHWLASKQIILVALLALVFAKIIPIANAIKQNLSDNAILDSKLRSLFNINSWMNLLVVVNILFALSRRLL
ncbi:MAG: hypothetical protein KKD86_08840 [Bacteroidetes bacterium]|nr:hypothetical protein [Bacteroidota bacterium]